MTNKKVVIGLGILGVAAIGAYAIVGWPPARQDNTGGSIGMAKKYRAEQIADADVALQDPQVQELIQSDTFYQLVTDANFRRSVTKDFQKFGIAMAGLNRALVASNEEASKSGVRVEAPIDVIYRTADALQLPAVQDALRSDDRVKMEDAARTANVNVADLELMRQMIRGLTPEAQAVAIQTCAELGRQKIKNPGVFGRTDIHDALARIGDNLARQDVQEALRTGDKTKMDEAAKASKFKIQDLEMLRNSLEGMDPDGRAVAIQGYTDLARLQIKYKELGRTDVRDALSRVGENLQKQSVQDALRSGNPAQMEEAAKASKIKIQDLEMLRTSIKDQPAEGQAQAIAAYTDFTRLNIKHKDLLGRSSVEATLGRIGDKVQMQAVQEALRSGDKVKMEEAAKQTGIRVQDLELLRKPIKGMSVDGQAHAITAYTEYSRLNIKHQELFGHGVTEGAMGRGMKPKDAEISRNFFTAVDNLNRGGALNNPKVRDGLARNNVAEAQKTAPGANVKDLQEVANVLKYADQGFQAQFVKDGLGKVNNHVADVNFQNVMGQESFGRMLVQDGLLLKTAVKSAEAGKQGLMSEMTRSHVAGQ